MRQSGSRSSSLAAVVVTVRGAALLRHSLPALLSQAWPFHRIIVVDNASPDAAAFVASYPRAERLALPRNLGFAVGANRGITEALADPAVTGVAVVNDDVTLDRGWSHAAQAALDADPRHGLCASSVLRAHDGRTDSAGIVWPAPGLCDNAGHGEDPPGIDEPARRVAGASASAVLYRRELLEDVGAFDEWLFAYQEDVDLSLRAAAHGWHAVLAPAARATHHGHASNRPFPLGGTWADYWNARNRLLVAVKSLPASEWRARWGTIVGVQAGLLLRSVRERRSGAVACGVLSGLGGLPRALRARRGALPPSARTS